ncbi:MAG: trypsin-like serine protease [Myxococcota bacterium]
MRTALNTLVALLPLWGCADTIGEVAPDRVYSDDGTTFVLATALTPPDALVFQEGPITWEYVGPREFPSSQDLVDVVELVDEDDPTEGLSDEPAQFRLEVDTARRTDELGHEWRIVDVDEEIARALFDDYVQRTAGDGGFHPEPGPEIRGDGGFRSNWTEYDCTTNPLFPTTKWVFNNGTSCDLHSSSCASQGQRGAIVDFTIGSGVMVHDRMALTAGHVAAVLVTGTSTGCTMTTNSTASSTCGTVTDITINSAVGGNADWALVEFVSNVGNTSTYDLSTGSDNFINDHDPRVAGFPAIERNREATCGGSSFLEGERNIGNYHALKNKEARVDLTAGSGTSGAPYYFWNSGASRYKVFGVHSGRAKTTLGNRYARGPKVPYWVSTMVSDAAGMGITL